MALWSCLLTGQQVHFVSSAADDGEGTLRSILQLANPFDTIRFQPGLDTVFLTSGELTINKSVYLEGNENVTFIKRDGSSPLFRLVRITSTDTLRVSFVRMGFTGGSALTGTEATVNGEGGGAVMAGDSVHDLSFEWCEFINNMSGDGVSDGWNGEEYFAGKGGHGGAIYTNSKGRLKDCLLKKNFCGTGGQCHKIVWNWYDLIGEDGGDGGAIYATANLVMENCRLDSNRAGNGRSAIGYGSDYVGAYAGKGGDGGGLVCTGDSLVITACEFTCNIAGSSGHAQSNQTASSKHGGNGGAVVGSGSAMAISNSVFTGNRAGNGGSVLSGGDQASGSDGGDGGALYGMGSVMVVAGSEFSSNMSGNGGNGSENYGGDGGNGGSGGGICAVSSEARFTGCWIENNKAGNGGNGPGGMGSSLKMNGGSGGGICISSATNDCYLVSCMVKSNISGDGGAHLAMRPGASGGHGGGMAYFEPSGLFTCHLVNCDVSFNAAGFARVP
ncbi:MAG: hypothetical protein MUC31_07485, partial [Bacteroidales bacterium]|nr:hypothetical protein [Bacteroidales bacterium]